MAVTWLPWFSGHVLQQSSLSILYVPYFEGAGATLYAVDAFPFSVSRLDLGDVVVVSESTQAAKRVKYV